MKRLLFILGMLVLFALPFVFGFHVIKLNAEKPFAYPARIHNAKYEIRINNEWVPITIKGVNMGMAKPGAFPGEAAITYDEYYRWFTYISEMNANTIRVYTIHPPHFYKALKDFNDEHEKKLYVIHGVWINEEALVASLDAFEETNLLAFQKEMNNAVDVIHGNITIPPKPGHSSGIYDSDISDYVIGWILGIEWYQYMVEETNRKYASIGEYSGTYFETIDAAPFEHWLANRMDEIIHYEARTYGSLRPIGFTNWPTTDILDHPSDSTMEDLVSVNPNTIYAKADMIDVGEFASYHIYPYYPDFINYDEKYTSYLDHRGSPNNYAGYLHDLVSHHRLPILVSEFGVPASRGKAHDNPSGWNQGFISEQQQGEIIGSLFEDILHQSMLGGLIFTWQDEWFKRTWNTMDLDNPDQRPYWSNAQTNEQMFGLLSFDRNKILVDGAAEEWENTPLYRNPSSIISSHNGMADTPTSIDSVYIDHDERYLYIGLKLQSEDNSFPLILLDTVDNMGSSWAKGGQEMLSDIEYIVSLNPQEPRILIDSYYDVFSYQYRESLLEDNPTLKDPKKHSGIFQPLYYALNKAYYLPDRNLTIPFSYYETGKLMLGNANPASPNYNSLTDYAIGNDGFVEIRIPWLLLQAKDPSQKEFMGDFRAAGLSASVFIENISLQVVLMDESGQLDCSPIVSYSWDTWEMPQYEERLKQSYYLVQSLYARYE